MSKLTPELDQVRAERDRLEDLATQMLDCGRFAKTDRAKLERDFRRLKSSE